MFKKISFLILILTLIHTIFVGSLILIQNTLWKENVKENILSEIKNEEKTELYFSYEEFNRISWKEGRKEFVLNGDYYDVISIQKNKKGLHISCWKDNKEQVFKKNISVVSLNSEKSPFRSFKIIFTNLNWFPFPQKIESIKHEFKDDAQSMFFVYRFSIKEFIDKIPLTPPKS